MDSISRKVEEIRKTSYELGFHDAKQISEQIYKKAFEDIRAELTDFAEDEFHRPNNDYESWAAVRTCLNIIDKYDPSKAGKEQNERV